MASPIGQRSLLACAQGWTLSRPGELVWTPERLAIARAVYAENGSPTAAARVLADVGFATNGDAVARALLRHGKSVMSDRPTTDGPPSTQKSQRVPSEGLDWEDASAPEAGEPRLRRAIVAHDIHVPAHSRVWLDLFKQVAVGSGADTIILNGDIVDGEALGRYGKRPGKTVRWQDEVVAANEFFDEIDALGIANRWAVWGNHDGGRWDNYIADRAPELHGLISLEGLLRLDARGWRLVDYKDHLFFGSCLLSHELGKGGKHAAKRTADDLHCDVSIGHTHQFCMSVRYDPMGKAVISSTFGWGADMHAAHYAYQAQAAASHVLGMGLMTWDTETGQTHCEPVPVINGRCVAHGKLYVSKVECPKPVRKVA